MSGLFLCALDFPPGAPAEVYRHPPPLLPAAHLFLGDGHRALEDDPLHGLAAGRRGQGAVVDKVLVRGVWQEASQGEGRHPGALTWGGTRGVSAAERGATAEEKEMEKKTQGRRRRRAEAAGSDAPYLLTLLMPSMMAA